MSATVGFLPLVGLGVLASEVKETAVKELTVVVCGGRSALSFGLGCTPFVSFLMVRWTVMRCVVALVTGSGQEEVEVPAAGRWWRCSGLIGRLLAARLLALLRFPRYRLRRWGLSTRLRLFSFFRRISLAMARHLSVFCCALARVGRPMLPS